MKTINETFTDEEYEILITAKKDKTWRQFILTLVKSKSEVIDDE